MLEIAHISKSFGTTLALDDVTMTVAGEIVAVLGPSGCGKSTLLRVVAGLETPEHGTICWDGEDLSEVPTHTRGFGLMFQSFALFPNRTVRRNVSFGLEMMGVPRADIAARVNEVLAWVDLSTAADRKVDGLSGGEKQRVALARTLAPEPRLVMLDEPLGSLDRLMRDRLIGEIRQILTDTGTPAIYVTHDHDEAERIGDRIALMRAGRLVQIDTLQALRSAPADPWVAEFLGIR